MSGGVLGSLLAGLPAERFFREHWGRRALHTRGGAARFSDLIDLPRLERAWTRCDHLKVYAVGRDGSPQERPVAIDDVPAALAKGATICATGLRGEPALDALLAGFARELLHAGDLSFNAYLSPDGGGFVLHLDDHPVWILQVEGRKRWRYSPEPGVREAPTTVTMPAGVERAVLSWGVVERPSDASLQEVVLEPGDALYLPHGCWHEARAIGRSLGLTLAVGRVTTLDLLRGWASTTLAADPALAAALEGLPASDPRAEIPPALRERFGRALAALRAAVARLDESDLYAAWRDRSGG